MIKENLDANASVNNKLNTEAEDIPAIEGGNPVREKLLAFAPPSLGQEEIDAVVDTIRSKWITMGKKTIEFENNLKNYVKAKHMAVVNSCTSALHLALLAHGIKDGEVITSPLTFTATANVIVHAGAKPVFADIDEKTYNIDPEEIKKKITEKTKAIIPVHYAGQPCNMDEIRKIAKEHGLEVIEDAAHAIGAEYNNEKIGKKGTACFSFYATKNMTTGDGGAVATDNDKVAERMEQIRFHGINKDAWNRYSKAGSWFYEVKEAGWKYNITDMQSAMGIVQLKKLDDFTKKRREIAKMFAKNLDKELFIIPQEAENVLHVRHLYPVQLNLKLLNIDRKKFIEAMKKEGIQTSVHFIPLHLQPFYKQMGYKEGDFPVAEAVYSQLVSLPIYSDMTEEDVQNVVDAANKITRFYKK